MASTGTGARKMSTSTIGISTTAVAMRFSKRSDLRRESWRRNYNQPAPARCFTFGSLRRLSDSDLEGLGREVRVSVAQPAISPLAFLILCNPFEQMDAAKIRPQGRGHVDFRVS